MILLLLHAPRLWSLTCRTISSLRVFHSKFRMRVASCRISIGLRGRCVRRAVTVVWVQTTAVGALEHWANHHRHMLTPERSVTRLAHLDEKAEGFALYPKLEPLPTDLHVKKIKYS